MHNTRVKTLCSAEMGPHPNTPVHPAQTWGARGFQEDLSAKLVGPLPVLLFSPCSWLEMKVQGIQVEARYYSP